MMAQSWCGLWTELWTELSTNDTVRLDGINSGFLVSHGVQSKQQRGRRAQPPRNGLRCEFRRSLETLLRSLPTIKIEHGHLNPTVCGFICRIGASTETKGLSPCPPGLCPDLRFNYQNA